MDNAPYHTRQLEKIPKMSSTKAEIRDYPERKAVEVSTSATKAKLLEELNNFVESRGGYSALCSYATEQICNGFGVRARTVQWLAEVADSASAWFREARRKEAEAWEKQMADNEKGDGSSTSSCSSCEGEYESEDLFSDVSDSEDIVLESE
ncbi:unnamed protein product [Cylicocyclus nassatus]|uniref:Uncharacterized protein n=1 Tax=Cylicocyclus nassatus TaxID=53992 RepID=A0AA36GST3_CYLNA|nr:unnamed protein product [Cylicocyclus nassatus]